MQQPETTLAIERPAVALQDLVDLLRVAGLHGMARGFLGHVLGQQRGGRTQVQLVDPLRLVGAQLALQEHGEQRVIAVPAAQAVQRLDEQAATLEPFEHLAAVTGLGQTIGQGGVEAVEQAGRLEKTAQVIGQPLDHLFAHVVADVRVAELQVFQEQVHAAAGLHFLQGQLQRAGPATDAAVETLDLLAIDADRHAQLQQRLHFVILESQLARVEQQQLMLDPQLGDTQFGQAPAAHQQGHPARHMAQEEAQAGDQLGVVQHLELVEHDQDRLVLARQFGQ